MKNGLRYMLIALTATVMASCVGNKKLAYLQEKDKRGDERFFSDAKVQTPQSVYKLQAGDVIYIRMEKFRVGEELFSISSFEQATMRLQVQHPYLLGHRIDEGGNISMPLIGTVKAEGLTLDELRSELNIRAEKEYPGSVVEAFQMDGTVSIVGEVIRAGRYPIFKERNTILDVIADAGDLKDYADRSNVKVVREENGEQSVFHIDLNSAEALSNPAFLLQNNDILVVVPLKRRKFVTANVQWLVSSVTALVAVSSLVLSITR
ncbi:MAG: polysaccharide biosynthesis/export family protein [Salibacteraceae bacterium]